MGGGGAYEGETAVRGGEAERNRGRRLLWRGWGFGLRWAGLGFNSSKGRLVPSSSLEMEKLLLTPSTIAGFCITPLDLNTGHRDP